MSLGYFSLDNTAMAFQIFSSNSGGPTIVSAKKKKKTSKLDLDIIWRWRLVCHQIFKQFFQQLEMSKNLAEIRLY
jgi:hypothetical protein